MHIFIFSLNDHKVQKGIEKSSRPPEGKAKVVTAGWVTELIQFNAVKAI